MRQHAVAAILVGRYSDVCYRSAGAETRTEAGTLITSAGHWRAAHVPVRVQLVISKYKGEETRKSPA